MDGKEQLSQRGHAAIAIFGGALILAALPLPWLSAGVGLHPPSYRGLDLAALAIPTALLSLSVVGFAVVWWRRPDSEFSTYAFLAAGAVLLFAVALLVAIEVISALIPTGLLPDTLRRSTEILSAGPGIWLALIGSVLVLTATMGVRVERLDLGSWAAPRSRRKLIGVALLLALVAACAWLRYQPWIASSVLGHGFDLPCQAAPWVGPASLVAVWLMGVSLLLAALSYVQIAGLVAAAAGWLMSFLAAVSMITSESLAELGIGDLIEESVVVQEVTFHAAPGAWESFVAGILVAMVGGFLVCLPTYSGGV